MFFSSPDQNSTNEFLLEKIRRLEQKDMATNARLDSILDALTYAQIEVDGHGNIYLPKRTSHNELFKMILDHIGVVIKHSPETITLRNVKNGRR
jgi:hypothetical protein